MQYFDTLTNQMVEFVPREPGKVSIYACGPTVYDVPHLGHARTALTYDVITRYLEWRGLDVTLVSNITDIDDKIIARAAEQGTSEPELAAEYTEIYVDQMRRLGIGDPDSLGLGEILDVKFRGCRYSFGYPACPELEDRATMVRLLEPGRIGVELSEELQLHPEQSTDALVVHHPEANYFKV